MLLQVWLSSIFGSGSVVHEWPFCWLRVGMGESIFLRRWGRKEVQGMLSFYVWGLKSPWNLFVSAFCMSFALVPKWRGAISAHDPVWVWMSGVSDLLFLHSLCPTCTIVSCVNLRKVTACAADWNLAVFWRSFFGLGLFVPRMFFLWDLTFSYFNKDALAGK